MMKNKFPVVYTVSSSNEITAAIYKHLLSNVSTARQERAERFLRFEDSCRTVLAELLLKYALKTSSNIDLHSISLSENQWKKPVIEGADIHFNLTHSGEWVMCVVDTFETGIDVEKIKKVDLGIVPRFFSTKEQELFASCTTETERLNLFSILWVLKESYIKAIGKGLYCPLDSFSVLPDNKSNVILERHDSSLPHKYFKLYDIGNQYRCAVCCTKNNFPQKITVVSIEELV